VGVVRAGFEVETASIVGDGPHQLTGVDLEASLQL